MFKDFQSTFWISKTSCSGDPIRYKRYSLSGLKILHFDTWLQPCVSETRDVDHPSLRYVVSTIHHSVVTNCLNDVSKWRMIKVTCRCHGWLKWSVEVDDFIAWVGLTFVSNQGYSPGAEILQDICFDYKKSRYGCFLSIYLQNTQVCLKTFL